MVSHQLTVRVRVRACVRVSICVRVLTIPHLYPQRFYVRVTQRNAERPFSVRERMCVECMCACANNSRGIYYHFHLHMREMNLRNGIQAQRAIRCNKSQSLVLNINFFLKKKTYFSMRVRRWNGLATSYSHTPQLISLSPQMKAIQPPICLHSCKNALENTRTASLICKQQQGGQWSLLSHTSLEMSKCFSAKCIAWSWFPRAVYAFPKLQHARPSPILKCN